MPGSAEKNEDGMDPPGDEMQQDSASEGKSKQKPTMNEPSMEMDSGMPMKMDEMSPPSNGKALFKDEDEMDEEMMPKAKMKGSKN